MKNVSISFVLVWLVSFMPASAADSLKFKSYEPGDHQAIFSGNWKENAFKSKADFHKSNAASSPLVIYNPGWGGANKYASAFKDIQSRLGDGYHHVFLSHSKNVDLAGRTVTIYQAIRAAKGAGIDPSKIYLIGASGGGQEAMHATHQKTASALSEGIAIDGVVAFYPSCRVSFEDKKFNEVKTLVFVGLKDKVAPPELCVELKRSHGLAHIEIRKYPEAGHSWLTGKRKKIQSQRTWGDCRINISQSGVWRGEGYDSENGIGALLKGMGKKCAKKKQMVIGRDSSVYDDSIQATIDFIRSL